MVLVKIILTFVAVKLCFCAKTIEIKLKQGILLGNVEKTLYREHDYYSFKGVPFAEPPTGELRFQPPIPHNGWDGKYEAFEIKPTCMQTNARIRKMVPLGISGSEDCLYINVLTPNLSRSAPVIVFDYNDNFRAGFNGTNIYSPEFFMEEGIVVVNINHRLGVFGYLTSEDNIIPANAGLRDFILGLEWVKSNIEKFGGDPEKVTLMGNRGGATIAEILLYSKRAKGLFSAAILQSGTAMESMYFHKFPKKMAFKLGESFNTTTNDSMILLEKLQSIDAKKLIEHEMRVIDDDFSNKYQISSFPFAPTIEYNNEDGIIQFLPEDGKPVNDVPIIIGFNSREGLDLTSHFIIEPRLLTHKVEENILLLPIRTKIRFDPESARYKEASREIIEYYLEDKSVHYGNILEYSVYVQDALQNYALNKAVKKLVSDMESPVYYYMFDYRGQLNEIHQYLTTVSRINVGHTGATVGDELCYLFVCTRIRKTYKQVIDWPTEQPEIKVLKKMVRMWSNFAKIRNPTPKDDEILQGVTWEPVKNTDTNYLHITKQFLMKTNPLGDKEKFWDDFLAKYRNLAIDGVVTDDANHDEL